jgi:hypothetical protein
LNFMATVKIVKTNSPSFSWAIHYRDSAWKIFRNFFGILSGIIPD